MLFSCLVYLTLGFFVEKLLNKTKENNSRVSPHDGLVLEPCAIKTSANRAETWKNLQRLGRNRMSKCRGIPLQSLETFQPLGALIWKYPPKLALSKKNRRENINSIPCHHHVWPATGTSQKTSQWAFGIPDLFWNKTFQPRLQPSTKFVSNSPKSKNTMVRGLVVSQPNSRSNSLADKNWDLSGISPTGSAKNRGANAATGCCR